MQKSNTNNQNGKASNQERIPNFRFLFSHCSELLTIILDKPLFPADVAIMRYFKEKTYLGSKDRAFISDNVYGVLRNIFWYDFVLNGEYTIREILLLHAVNSGVVSEAQTEKFDAFCEALQTSSLKIEQIKIHIEECMAEVQEYDDVKRLSLLYSIPEFITQEVLKWHKISFVEELFASLRQQAPISLRANTLVAPQTELSHRLMEQGIDNVLGELSKNSILLTRRINANSLPEFKQGYFELQDEGSQLICEMLDPKPTWKIFDACAGSGGKALQLAALMKGRGEIIIHDINERRLSESKHRVRRSTAQNIRKISHDEYLEKKTALISQFDVVIIDAPCTGVGVLRRNPGAVLSLDTELLLRMKKLQQEVLAEYSKLVKKGGLLLYATCSLLHTENELQIEKFLEANKDWKIKKGKLDDKLLTEQGFMRLWSHKHNTDCFFAALLERI